MYVSVDRHLRRPLFYVSAALVSVVVWSTSRPTIAAEPAAGPTVKTLSATIVDRSVATAVYPQSTTENPNVVPQPAEKQLSEDGPPDYECHTVGDSRDVVRPTRAGMVLMGGGTDIDDCFRWMVERSGGGDFVVIRSSGTSAYNPYIYSLHSKSGLRADSVTTLIVRTPAAARDPSVLEKIARAEAIWIAGGDQAKHVRAWRDTPLAQAVEAAVGRGVPIGGTSSGLDVMGEYIFSAEMDLDDTPHLCTHEAMRDPFLPRITLARNLFRLPHLGNAMLESHFVQHDRMGRTIAFLGRVLQSGWTGEARAIGIQAKTALLIEPDGRAEVVCGPTAEASAVYFMRMAAGTTACRPGLPVIAEDVTVDQVAPGESFNLATWSGPQAVRYTLAVAHGRVASTHTSGKCYPPIAKDVATASMIGGR
jgi:cyanophycinase-like exopeptidase